MTLVDTCFLIDLIKGDPDALAATRSYHNLRTCAICSAEFLYGVKITGKSELIRASQKFLRYFPVLPFDAESAYIYADIAATLKNRGRHISSFDELIAATAIRHDQPLMSRDNHFSEIDGLELIVY